MKLVPLTDEGDKPVMVNADAVCFFRRSVHDRVEIHFLGETKTTVRGAVEFVKIALKGVLPVADVRAHESVVHQDSGLARQN